MSSAFSNLFQSIEIGSYQLKNRIMNTGHAAHHQHGDGTPTDAYLYYLKERAKGGAGIIVTGHTVPVYDGETSLSLTNFHDRIIPTYQRIADAVHAYDVPILAQMGHRGRRFADASAFIGRPSVAPSATPPADFSVPMYTPHVLNTAEAEAIVEAFGKAAQRMREADFDGVEIAVGMDYLFANFLHSHSNNRSDKYGGATIEERMTFLSEVLQIVRDELGPQRLVGVRLYDDALHYSLNLSDLVEIAKLLEKAALVDYFNVWHGIVPNPREGRGHWPSYYFPPGAFTHLSEAVKKVVNLPVVGTGRLDSPAAADRALAEGKADLVGMVKTLIADPHFPNKVRANQIDDIRTCIGCTQACVGHVDLGLGVGCIYNPVTGREQHWAAIGRAPQRKRIVIVGGGPAGCEAARVAAERGHEVILFERHRRLGGQVNLVMKAPDRQSFEEVIRWFEHQLAKLGVEVRLGQEADSAKVLEESPDAIIVATGSRAWLPEVEGIDRPQVVTARAVMSGEATLGAKCLVVDTVGRAEAATTADWLRDQGHQVDLLTGLETIAPHMPSPTRHHLLEKLMSAGVGFITQTALWSIGESQIDAYNVVTFQPLSLSGYDNIVFGSGGIAEPELFDTLSAEHASVHIIGDAYQSRDIEIAVVEGHRIGRKV